MQDSIYGPLNTTIRVKEVSLLDKTQYDRILTSESFDDAVRVLMDTPYQDKIEKMANPNDYEEVLMNELKATYQWIIRESPSQLLNELITLGYAYHNIKVLFKEKQTGKKFDHTLIDIGLYPIYELRRAVSTGHSDVLSRFYLQNIRNINLYFEDTPRVNEIDIFVDRAYIHHLKRLAEEINDHDITELVNQYIDDINISIVFRTLVSGREIAQLQATLTDEGSIPVDYLREVSQGGLDHAIQVFGESNQYSDIIDQSVDEAGVFSVSQFEQALDNASGARMKQTVFEVFGPLPVLAYVMAKEDEIENIRLVLTAKINHIDSAVIRDRMRFNYAI